MWRVFNQCSNKFSLVSFSSRNRKKTVSYWLIKHMFHFESWMYRLCMGNCNEDVRILQNVILYWFREVQRRESIVFFESGIQDHYVGRESGCWTLDFKGLPHLHIFVLKLRLVRSTVCEFY